MNGRVLAVAIAMTFGTSAVLWAQDEMRTEEVRFAAGTNGTTISDRITGYETVLYTLGAEAGQRMQVRLEPSNLATYFNVYAPGKGPGDEALANAGMMGEMVPDLNRFDGVLPGSGEYTISVYMMRSAARRAEVSDYELSISIDGATGDTVQNDYADGLQGGPDFLRVATSGGGVLNLRAAPSGGAVVVTTLANGQNVRNLGCRMEEARRWCRVATLADPGGEGWAAGDYLVEGSNDPAAGTTATSADTPDAAGQACLRAVTEETGNAEVVVLSSSFSEAGTEVIVGVGSGQAPWQCIAYRDGSTTRPMSLTDEGAL
ncbi:MULTISPECIES: SH3 domain-containing protein [unclassified Roseovarius]|uniref:SH3 domain-containing protein n=1 Tax=unclassified Roseovarius TaxID=2614913 RepID=UPI00273F97E1|nr:SH3 domain-containing protein [Roseovarius sp. MMSF_3350]